MVTLIVVAPIPGAASVCSIGVLIVRPAGGVVQCGVEADGSAHRLAGEIGADRPERAQRIEGIGAMKPENVTETGAAVAALARTSNGAAARGGRRRMVTFRVTRRPGWRGGQSRRRGVRHRVDDAW
jgi:hypothetical protein